jgi:hypothetical protein
MILNDTMIGKNLKAKKLSITKTGLVYLSQGISKNIYAC